MWNNNELFVNISVLNSCRKRAREGPNERIAPEDEEDAVTKAIRLAAERPDQPIFFPYKGTVFNSCDEAKEFYNLYSWEKGFGIRIGRGCKNSKEYRTRQDFVCSCEVHTNICCLHTQHYYFSNWTCNSLMVFNICREQTRAQQQLQSGLNARQ
jgi:hypothetical protein